MTASYCLARHYPISVLTSSSGILCTRFIACVHAAMAAFPANR
jgi:hypothetical protein